MNATTTPLTHSLAMEQVNHECTFAEPHILSFLNTQEEWLVAACDYHRGSAIPLVEMLRRGKMDLTYTLAAWEVYYKQKPNVRLQAVLSILRNWLALQP